MEEKRPFRYPVGYSESPGEAAIDQSAAKIVKSDKKRNQLE
ncbi:MAG TPA: hypothetical protein PKA10_03635 [Selenomonadales bacterium]|nr:hypothetical protein [Selenomonadales bacterium]